MKGCSQVLVHSSGGGREESSWKGIVPPDSPDSVPWPVITSKENAACMTKGDLGLKWKSQEHAK